MSPLIILLIFLQFSKPTIFYFVVHIRSSICSFIQNAAHKEFLERKKLSLNIYSLCVAGIADLEIIASNDVKKASVFFYLFLIPHGV
jgi:hypothetical protein